MLAHALVLRLVLALEGRQARTVKLTADAVDMEHVESIIPALAMLALTSISLLNNASSPASEILVSIVTALTYCPVLDANMDPVAMEHAIAGLAIAVQTAMSQLLLVMSMPTLE